MDQEQKEIVEQHLLAARKVMREALRKCQAEGINPTAIAQVLGENAVQLMIANFGADAGKEFCKSLTQEAVRMAHFYRTQARPATQAPD